VLVAVTPSTRPPTREVVSEGHRLGRPPLVGPNPVSTSATAKSRTVASTQLIVPVGDALTAGCQATSATLPGQGKQTNPSEHERIDPVP
jgi:hypothetical protein